MAFTLAKASARSNSHRPSARPRPPADPVPELVRGVAMQHPGREARGVALAFDAHPRHSDLREFAERGSVERRATGRERSEEHTSELQSQSNLVCRLLLEKKNLPGRGLRRAHDRVQGASRRNRRYGMSASPD